MNEDMSKSNKRPPVKIIAAAGNTVLVTDQWVEQGGALCLATVIDKVTDDRRQVVLVETDDQELTTLRWLRRVSATRYVETDIYAIMDYVPDDHDEFIEEFTETINNAEMELVMAVGLFPRYDLEAEWLDQSQRDYLNTVQARVDDADPEEVEMKRRNLFGALKLF